MGLSLDEFKEATKRRTGPRCSVAVTLGLLDADDSAALSAALADPTITGSAIELVMKAAGHNLGQNMITRHRRGGCSCDQTVTALEAMRATPAKDAR